MNIHQFAANETADNSVVLDNFSESSSHRKGWVPEPKHVQEASDQPGTTARASPPTHCRPEPHIAARARRAVHASAGTETTGMPGHAGCARLSSRIARRRHPNRGSSRSECRPRAKTSLPQQCRGIHAEESTQIRGPDPRLAGIRACGEQRHHESGGLPERRRCFGIDTTPSSVSNIQMTNSENQRITFTTMAYFPNYIPYSMSPVAHITVPADA